MKNYQPTLEHALYALALVIAAGLRFINLGALPLSDFEASWALQALHITQGLKPAIGPNPAFVHLTAVLFFMFGPTNFLARFWPALAGTALILAPWFLRGRIGRLPALILAFGLAIDPGLAALSRLAGGPMLAVAFMTFAAMAWIRRRSATAGIFAGLALSSGPSIWLGLAGVGLTWAFASGIGRKPLARDEAETVRPSRWTKEVRIAFLWGVGTLILAGSLFFLSPNGLSAIIAGFTSFVSGWWTLSNVPLWQVLMTIPAYEILPFFLALAGVIRGIKKKETLSLQLGIWVLIALFLPIIYPGRQTGDVAWVLLPLWALAAIELALHFDFRSSNPWEVVGTAAVVIAFIVFGWLNLAAMTNMDWGSDLVRTREWLLAAVLLLIVLSLLLVGTGWSANVARLGGVWAGVITLTLFTIALATGSTGIRTPLTAELWLPEPRSSQMNILHQVASQISDLNRGDANQLPLTILNVNSPALTWLFRDWQVQEVSTLSPDSSPAMVISTSQTLNLAAKYRGEGLVLYEAPAWDQVTPAQLLKWFIYRQIQLANEKVILWVRSDLMLDSQGAIPTQ